MSGTFHRTSADTVLRKRKPRDICDDGTLNSWKELLICFKIIGFYHPNVLKNKKGFTRNLSAWTFLQSATLCFQWLMMILSTFSYTLYDTDDKSLFKLVDGLLPIMMIVTGAAYQSIMIYKSNAITKFFLSLAEISRNVNVKLDFKLKKTVLFLILISLFVPFIYATAYVYHMKDLKASNLTAYYFSDKPYLLFTGIYIVVGNSQPALYPVVLIAQIAIVFLAIFGPLSIEVFICKIMHSSNLLYRKCRNDLKHILRESKEVSLDIFKKWLENYRSVSRLAEEAESLLSPIILVFSLLVPCIAGMVAYEAAQISSMISFLTSWQSKIGPIFMILVHSIRLGYLSIKGEEFINEASILLMSN